MTNPQTTTKKVISPVTMLVEWLECEAAYQDGKYGRDHAAEKLRKAARMLEKLNAKN